MQINEEGTLLDSVPTSFSLSEKQSHYLNTKEKETFKKALTSSLCLKQLLVKESVRHVNDKDYLRKIPRVVW